MKFEKKPTPTAAETAGIKTRTKEEVAKNNPTVKLAIENIKRMKEQSQSSSEKDNKPKQEKTDFDKKMREKYSTR